MKDGTRDADLCQPAYSSRLLPREWLHGYHHIRLSSKKRAAPLTVQCTSANWSLMDVNPRWFVRQIIKYGGRSLFMLYLDTTNRCPDACPMCFTAESRQRQGIRLSLPVDLAITRVRELQERYDTLAMVSLAGPGEPLVQPDLEKLLSSIREMGLACRIYTAGASLISKRVQNLLLENCRVLRVSLDAATSDTFFQTHARRDFDQRIRSIEALSRARANCDSEIAIGCHFVVQRSNYMEILPFLRLMQDIGADFVVYSQETFGNVDSHFRPEEVQQISTDLLTAEDYSCPSFRVVTPRKAMRRTYSEFEKSSFYEPDALDRCYNSSNRAFFGVDGDFSACWLSTLDEDFLKESYLGPLSEDETMRSLYKVVDTGFGSTIKRSAQLSCNSCVANNYNNMVRKILDYADGLECNEVDVDLIPSHSDTYNAGFAVGDQSSELVLREQTV